MSTGFIPTREQSERIVRAVTHYERTAALLPPLEQRRIVGSGGACKKVMYIYIRTNASLVDLSGTFSITFTYDGTSDTVVIAPSDSLATIQTAFEGHAGIGTGNVTVSGTSLWLTGAQVQFKDFSLLNQSSVGVSNNVTDARGNSLNIFLPYGSKT